MSWFAALKRWWGGESDMRYVLVVVSSPWTEEMIRRLAPYWASSAVCAIAEQPGGRERLLEAFDGDQNKLRKALELAEIAFFRFFPIVGLLTRADGPEKLRRLPFCQSVYAPPDDYGFDYLRILKGLHWVLEYNQEHPEAKINVANMSLQAPVPYPFDPLEPMNVATRVLTEHGVTVVVAAGNHGAGGEGTLNPWAAPPWVISAGAAYADGKRLWEHSSCGLPGSPYHPTVVAHGVDVIGLRSPEGVYAAADDEGHYAIASGTSFAAPQVSGMAAVIIQFIQERLAPSPLAAEWRGKLETEFGLRALPVAASPRVVKRMIEHFAVPMPGYGRHQQGAGFVSGPIVQERLANFRLSDFIQVFGVRAAAAPNA